MNIYKRFITFLSLMLLCTVFINSFMSFAQVNEGETTKVEDAKNNIITESLETKDKGEVRYPNKLTAKQNSSALGSQKEANTFNKGIASSPSNARANIIENVDNGNKAYLVHHGDSTDSSDKDKYSADARQFLSFQTKSGKVFYLIINHDEKSENVILLTEVSEDDLLNMTEKKEEPKPVIPSIHVEDKKEPVKPVKSEKNTDIGTYLFLFIVIIGALGTGYYFKVIKKKETEELKEFEKDEDNYYTQAEENDNENGESDIAENIDNETDDELL